MRTLLLSLLAYLVSGQLSNCNETNGRNEDFIRTFRTWGTECTIEDDTMFTNDFVCRGIGCLLIVDIVHCRHNTDDTWSCGVKKFNEHSTTPTKVHNSLQKWEYIPKTTFITWKIECVIEGEKILSRLCSFKMQTHLEKRLTELCDEIFLPFHLALKNVIDFLIKFLNRLDNHIASVMDSFSLDWSSMFGILFISGIYAFSIVAKKRIHYRKEPPTKFTEYKPVIPPEESVEDEELSCLICKDKKKIWCAQPCGHIIACDQCFRSYNKRYECPFCRQATNFWVVVRT